MPRWNRRWRSHSATALTLVVLFALAMGCAGRSVGARRISGPEADRPGGLEPSGEQETRVGHESLGLYQLLGVEALEESRQGEQSEEPALVGRQSGPRLSQDVRGALVRHWPESRAPAPTPQADSQG